MKDYYELLGVSRTAIEDDIKHAFRREIARYHPDKVHHLGTEFQEIAATRAATLTQAYQTLSDAGRRAAYDAQLNADTAVVRVPLQSRLFSQERLGATAVVRRAAIERLRSAIHAEFDRVEQPLIPGFDVVCIPARSFWSLKAAPAIVGRFVPVVDAAAVREAIELARMMRRDTREVCLVLMGPELAVTEIAAAIDELRRKPASSGGRLTVVPVDIRVWKAHVPADVPAAVATLLSRLTST